MNAIEKIYKENEQRSSLILKAFDNEIEKGGKLNHKYLRKEGDKYIYTETGSLKNKKFSEMSDDEKFLRESKHLSDNFKSLLTKQAKEKEGLDDKYNNAMKEYNDIAYKYPRSEDENKRILELQDEIHKIIKKQEIQYKKHNKEKDNLFKKENPEAWKKLNDEFDFFVNN